MLVKNYRLSEVEQGTDNSRTSNGNQDNSMETENINPSIQDKYPPKKKNYRQADSTKVLDDVTNMVSDAIERSDVGNAISQWCKKVICYAPMNGKTKSFFLCKEPSKELYYERCESGQFLSAYKGGIGEFATAVLLMEKEKFKKQEAKNLLVSGKYQPDVRLEHIAIYLIKCDAPSHVTERAILESFLTDTTRNCEKEDMYNICQEVQKKLGREQQAGELGTYKLWKERHSIFQRANLAFLNGLEYLYSHNFQESLLYLTYAVKLNSQLSPNAQLLNKDLLRRATEFSLLKLSEKAFGMFKTDSDHEACKALDLMIQQVIPSMNSLDSSPVLERIRDQWLALCLEKPRVGTMQERIEDFVQYLLEGNSSSPTSEPPLLNCDLDCKTLTVKCSKIMSRVNKSPEFLELSKV